jgi:hypothetical protein
MKKIVIYHQYPNFEFAKSDRSILAKYSTGTMVQKHVEVASQFYNLNSNPKVECIYYTRHLER